MRFYVPEWDDHVDEGYDFIHDEHSYLDKQKRNMVYIWDIFDKSTTPIDGVLISREQVEDTPAKFDRLTTHGVYEDPELSVPEWMPTISDCGAWGYKSLPFPPYDNKGMLEFYETLNVSVGVTIDHLVLGSGHSTRLYINESALPEELGKSDVTENLGEEVDDIMIDSWPEEWPEYVSEYEPTICTEQEVTEFDSGFLNGDSQEVVEKLKQDPRAVYREDDMEFRYNLTLRNAEEMWDLYNKKDYSFRLMAAIQGWHPRSYVNAAEEVLDKGYGYIGIGGVAGSREEDVKEIVSAVGDTVRRHQIENTTRVDMHVFGFAKTGAFEEVGKNGVASFDSASMLRAAWTGGSNYHLSSDRRYDALRVRYPSHKEGIADSVETALRGQEVLHSVRAFDEDRSISEAIERWHESADKALRELVSYLEENRWDEKYDADRLMDVQEAFREDYDHSHQLKASFGKKFQSRLNKLLRRDREDRPVDWEEYLGLIGKARRVFDREVPTQIEEIKQIEDMDDTVGSLNHVWRLIESYAEYTGDEDLLESYLELLLDKPWEECGCRICEEHSIEVAIFRGNNRNRRRGFHNTRRFYDEFEDVLPKILALTVAEEGFSQYNTVEKYLREERSGFWREVHNLPIAEVGVLTSGGVLEWWEDTKHTGDPKPEKIQSSIGGRSERYQEILLQKTDLTEEIDIDEKDTKVRTTENISKEVESLLDFPIYPQRKLNILVVDQCSNAKKKSTLPGSVDSSMSRQELIEHEEVPVYRARNLYEGRQQKFISNAVDSLRESKDEVDRIFISAGFGVIDENDLLPPYDMTFAGLSKDEINERSAELGIQESLSDILSSNTYDIIFFALGSDYLLSLDMEELTSKISDETMIVTFNNSEAEGKNQVSIPARTEDAKEQGTIVVALKGRYLQNFAEHRTRGSKVEDVEDLVEYCTTQLTSQSFLYEY
jgi:hypothetical protein